MIHSVEEHLFCVILAQKSLQVWTLYCLLSMPLASLYRMTITDKPSCLVYIHICAPAFHILKVTLHHPLLFFSFRSQCFLPPKFRSCSMFNCLSRIFWALFGFARSLARSLSSSYTRTSQTTTWIFFSATAIDTFFSCSLSRIWCACVINFVSSTQLCVSHVSVLTNAQKSKRDDRTVVSLSRMDKIERNEDRYRSYDYNICQKSCSIVALNIHKIDARAACTLTIAVYFTTFLIDWLRF